jgi:hypothetical protein
MDLGMCGVVRFQPFKHQHSASCRFKAERNHRHCELTSTIGKKSFLLCLADKLWSVLSIHKNEE